MKKWIVAAIIAVTIAVVVAVIFAARDRLFQDSMFDMLDAE